MSTALKRIISLPDSLLSNNKTPYLKPSKEKSITKSGHTLFPETRLNRRDFRCFPFAAPSLQGNFWSKPRLSIIIPVYNHAEFLAPLLSSLIRNSPLKTEIIIVDDGSEDNFEESFNNFNRTEQAKVLEQYSIKLFRRSNMGISAALNFGLQKASGDFISWQSADNIIVNNGYSKLVNFLQANPSVLAAYGNIELIDKTGNSVHSDGYRPQDLAKPGSNKVLLPYAAESLNFIPDNFMGAMFAYRRVPVFSQLSFKSELLGAEDYAFSLEIGRFGKIAHLDSEESICAYRLHKNTLTENLKQTHIQSKTKELILREKEFRDVLNFKDLKIVSKKILKKLKKRKKLESTYDLFGDQVKTKLNLIEDCSSLEILLGQNCYLDISFKNQNFRVLPPLNIPPYLKKARDCYFRTFNLNSEKDVSFHALLLTTCKLSKSEETCLERLLIQIPGLCLNIVKLESSSGDAPSSAQGPDSEEAEYSKLANFTARINQISLSNELETSEEGFFQALTYVLSSNEYLLSFSEDADHEESKYNFKNYSSKNYNFKNSEFGIHNLLKDRCFTALAATAGIPLVYLNPLTHNSSSNNSSIPKNDYPFILSVSQLEEEQLEAKLKKNKSRNISLSLAFKEARDKLNISSAEQWLLKNKTEPLKDEIKAYLAHAMFEESINLESLKDLSP